MKRCISLLLAVFLLLGFSSLALANRPVKNQFQPEPLWSKDLTLRELLDLTDEQVAQIRSIREEYLEEVERIRTKIKGDISSSYRQELRTELSDLFEKYWGKTAELLTPVQLSRLVPRRIATFFLYDPEGLADPSTTSN
ncbi:MAG TPA: hypothetical protein PLK33_05335 [bacterium]|nr:hypothetical protein [bacterium]HOP56128.1 hypothetical protein [bacterium]